MIDFLYSFNSPFFILAKKKNCFVNIYKEIKIKEEKLALYKTELIEPNENAVDMENKDEIYTFLAEQIKKGVEEVSNYKLNKIFYADIDENEKLDTLKEIIEDFEEMIDYLKKI